MQEIIRVDCVSKVYKLYKKPSDRIKEIFAQKSYHKNFNALDNISFSVKRGETLGIIGKNGAGKSTLLKILTGVSVPSSGEIMIAGEVSALLELGTGFNPEYTGIQNIYLNGTMRGLSKEDMDALVGSITDFADIGEYIDQPVKTYSSGMFARLAFSVMISFKPKILIVDEALSVGDVFFQQKCNVFMKEKMKDVTKILVTHDMNTIINMADKVILLDNGKVIDEGEPLQVVEHYLRIMHTAVYSSSDASKNASEDKCYDVPGVTKLSKGDSGEVSWNQIDSQHIGGAGDIRILQYAFAVNDVNTDIVKPGDDVEVKFKIKNTSRIDNVVCGYNLKDKYGNTVFGENSVGSKIRLNPLEANFMYKVTLHFEWPEIMEGDYFLTIGVGEGTDEMVHIIQCWAHNIACFKALSLRPMHGIINNEIRNVIITKEEGRIGTRNER